ncbi:MAG: hypothetical protein F6J98_17505 [Moorea sp. SIO4G2]|nr:hypothetical protein [Moorena sp. SIO4G2]
MKLKVLTPAILGSFAILVVASPSWSQGISNTQLPSENLKTDISSNIHIAQTKQSRRYRGDFSQFLLKLGQRETGQANPPYNIENRLGFIGKYQFGEALLIDLKYYQAQRYYNGGSNGVDKNYWRGSWTGKNGINSKADFLRNKNQVQERAIREAFKSKWSTITQQLSIKNYLGRSVGGVPITCSGILAAAHLRGEYGVINLLGSGTVSRDEFGTSILQYLKEFQGYDTPYCR